MPAIRVPIPDYELRDLYHAMHFPEKVASGCLMETLKHADVKPAKQFAGVSYHITLVDGDGTRLARVHYITTESGRTLYWPTYVRVRNVKIIRFGHQRPPWSRWRLRLRWEVGHIRRRLAEARKWRR